MSHDYHAERAEIRYNDEAKPQVAPISLQIQELEMQIDRIEKMAAAMSERISPILTPDHPREAKAQIETEDRAETSNMARTLQRQVVRVNQTARTLENLYSRIEL